MTATLTPAGAVSARPVPAEHFTIATDGFGDVGVWAQSDADDHPEPVLMRFILGVTPAADALWSLIVAAVEAGQS